MMEQVSILLLCFSRIKYWERRNWRELVCWNQEPIMALIINSCRERNSKKFHLSRDLLTIAYLMIFSTSRRRKKASICMKDSSRLETKMGRDREGVRVAQREKRIPRMVKKRAREGKLQKTVGKVIGLFRKTKNTTGSWKSTTATLSVKRWGDWIRSLRRWLCLLVLDKLNNAEAIIKKCRKSTTHFQTSYFIWGEPITPQKIHIPSTKTWTIIKLWRLRLSSQLGNYRKSIWGSKPLLLQQYTKSSGKSHFLRQLLSIACLPGIWVFVEWLLVMISSEIITNNNSNWTIYYFENYDCSYIIKDPYLLYPEPTTQNEEGFYFWG